MSCFSKFLEGDRRCTYNVQRPKGQEAVTVVAVGPGVPARVIPLLQDKLLPTEGSALKCQPPVGGKRLGSSLLQVREDPSLVRERPITTDL